VALVSFTNFGKRSL